MAVVAHLDDDAVRVGVSANHDGLGAPACWIAFATASWVASTTAARGGSPIPPPSSHASSE